LPLKSGCVDVFIDFFGSNEHNIYHPDPLIDQWKALFSAEAVVSGTYFSFDAFSKSICRLIEEYPEASNKNFSLPGYLDALQTAGFTIMRNDSIGTVLESGDNLAFSFHIQGEKMTLTVINASRSFNALSL